jgi:N-acyl-D-aspartate/D-glutamate deacylase
MNDVLVKGGTLVDGTGKSAITGDIAFTNGRITEVGKDLGAAAQDHRCGRLAHHARRRSTSIRIAMGSDLGPAATVAKGCWVSTVVMATATSVLLPPDLTGASG